MTKTKAPVIYTPVYIPDTPDCEYEFGEKKLSKEKIKYLAKSFNRYKNIDLQHEYTKLLLNKKIPKQRGELIESYILQKQTKMLDLQGKVRTYPEGTWIVGIKITDKTAMMLYNQGKLSGVSATAKKRKDADFLQTYVAIKRAEKNMPEKVDIGFTSAKSVQKIPKRILLSNIKDPVVFTISLVEKPCVFGAKFCNKSCMIVNKKNMEDTSMSLMDTIKEKLNTAIDDIDLEQLKEESQKSEPEEVIVETEEQEEDEKEEEVKEEEEETSEEEEEETPEEETLEEAGEESQKSYVTRDEASEMFRAGFQKIRGDLEQLVDENITASITALQESQKEALGYVTGDDVKEIFNEEFQTFKTDFEEGLKQRQEESIKQFSKTIENNTTIIEKPVETKPQNKLFQDRDANGCKIRK